MECFIVEPGDVDGGRIYLRDDEARHAVKSLRLREGDELLATDLSGTCYQCRLYQLAEGNTVVVCAVENVLKNFGEPRQDVLLIQGMISQPARWEFLLEKATELGVRIIQPVTTERTEHIHFKHERSERILRAAVKQTKRSLIPEIRLRNNEKDEGNSELSSLREALSEAVQESRKIVLLHESAPFDADLRKMIEASDEKLAIVVGPEGGFSDSEVSMAVDEFHAAVVSLGSRRLRAETAAIAALAIAIQL